MKKIVFIALVISVALCLCSCGRVEQFIDSIVGKETAEDTPDTFETSIPDSAVKTEEQTEAQTDMSPTTIAPTTTHDVISELKLLGLEGKNLLNCGLYEYSEKCVVYEGLKKILNNELKYQRVYYYPCEPNTEYSMRYFDDDVICFLASTPNHPEKSDKDGDLTAVMSNRFEGAPLERILTIKTGAEDKYLIFAYNVTELSTASTKEKTDAAYEELINKTVIKKGNSLVISGYENEKESDKYYHDEYYTEGILLAVKKAESMANIKWTPLKDMPSMNGAFTAGMEQSGLPYSSVKLLNKFVGIDVLFETYMTCLENPNGILYSYNCKNEQVNNLSLVYDSSAKKNVCTEGSKIVNTVSQVNASCYYGTVCSSIVGFALGLPCYETTYSWANRNMQQVPLSVDDMRSGDVVIQYHPETGGGHTVIVLDVERDSTGKAKCITFAESNYSNCHTGKMTVEEFRLTYLVKSQWNEYKGAKIYRYTELNKNVNAEFYPSSLYSSSDGGSVLYLDERFDRVGCVFIGGKEFFDFEYNKDTMELWLNLSASTIAGKRIVVCRSDMDRSLLTSKGDYNYGNGVIMLDKGNKSPYAKGEIAVITIFDGKGTENVCITREGKTYGEYPMSKAVDMGNNTHTVDVKTDDLEGGYYVAEAHDKDGNVIGTQEFMVYGASKTVIQNSYAQNGVIVPKNGMIQGKVTEFDAQLTPIYVSRTDASGVVYDTAEIAEDGSFKISSDANSAKMYIKVHFACNYGRVTTPAYQVYYGNPCK